MRVVERLEGGLVLLEPKVYEDQRGHFFESYNEFDFTLLGIGARFVQDNESHSKRSVLRGLHYQVRYPQGKLVRVTSGEIFDVAVDLRKGHPNFGRWCSTRLSAENRLALWIPPGFAHGFLVLTDSADVQYKTTQSYAPEFERTLLWNDPELGIDWPLSGEPILSAKDLAGLSMREAEVYSV